MTTGTMKDRIPATHLYYVTVTVAWYLAVLVSGGIAAALITTFYNPDKPIFLIIEIGLAFITVSGVVAPLVVGLVLRHLKDPAAGMTVSALMMLGHVMLISGPLFFGTPIVSRYFAFHRHNSGGY